MNVQIISRKAAGKGSDIVTTVERLGVLLVSVMTGHDATGKQVSKTQRVTDALTLAKSIDGITAKFPNMTRLSVSGYKTLRSIDVDAADGSKVKKPVAFDASLTVENLNLSALFAGIANDLSSESGKLSTETKAMKNLAVKEEAAGYKAGKRGRQGKSYNPDLEAESLLASL